MGMRLKVFSGASTVEGLHYTTRGKLFETEKGVNYSEGVHNRGVFTL